MKLENYTPKKPFSQKHLLRLQDYTKDEILQVLSLALDLKAKQKAHIPHKLLEQTAFYKHIFGKLRSFNGYYLNKLLIEF